MTKTLPACTLLSLCLLLGTNAVARDIINTPTQPFAKNRPLTLPHTGTTPFNSYNESPFYFIHNAGQVKDQYGNLRHDIDYKLDAGGMVMFIGDAQIHYQWSRSENSNLAAAGEIPNSKFPPAKAGPDSQTETYRMDVKLLGADRNAQVVAEGIQQYKEMYYLPYRKDALVAHSYTRITYKDVYPDIDWVIYIASNASANNSTSPLGGKLKYDFIVHPGGNPADIKIQYNGATSLQLKDGDLIAATPMGSITENAPYSYYADSKQQVSTSFKLNGNILSYNIPNSLTPNSQPLIIDPQLLWGTYYGGADRTGAGKIAVDAANNIYMAGFTSSTTNIATSGSFQSSYAGASCSACKDDGFLVKFTPEGKRLWATYYGGTETDGFYCIAISGTALYISGTSQSNGLATTGSHQASNNNGDALLVKFDTAGSRIWATYYGGSTVDDGGDVACDASGNVYLSGTTTSTNDIATSGSHQSAYAGNTDMYLVKFSSAGVRQWGTYYGGTASEVFSGPMLACDASGNVYLAADVLSAGLGTTGTFQPTYSGSVWGDALLAKFTSGGALSWATYYGETGLDVLRPHIAVDGSGNVYMTGDGWWPIITPTTYFATTGCYQSTYGGGYLDGFIVKFNNTGGRVWGTFYGSTGDDRISNVQLSPLTGNLYISVRTDGTGLATPEAYQTFPNGSYDAMVLVFTPGGSRVHATYYGGGDLDDAGWLMPDNYGRVYTSGNTQSTYGIATPGAHQTTNNATVSSTNYNAYLAAFVPDTAVFIQWPYTDTVLCAGDSLIVKDTVFYGFRSNNTFTVQLSNAAGSFASPVNIGSVSSRVSGNIRCRIPVNTPGGSGYRIRIVANNIPFTSADDYYNIRIKPNVQSFSLVNSSPVCIDDTIRAVGATTSTGVTWQWTGPLGFSATTQAIKRGGVTTAMAGYYKVKITLTSSGCSVTDSANITTKPIPDKPVAGSNTPVCYGQTIHLSATTTTTGVSWYWQGPMTFTSTLQNPSKSSATVLDAGSYIVMAVLNACATSDTVTVLVHPAIPALTANSNSPVCIGSTINLNANTIPGATYAWTGPASYTDATQNPAITNAQLGHAGTYSVIATVNNCLSPAATTNVVVAQGPVVFVYPSPGDTICPGKNLTLNARVTGTAVSPVYQWLKNGANIPTANNLTYVDNTTADGDKYSILYTPGAGSACTTPITSNAISITVPPYKAPAVSMTATDTNAWPGLLVNFTATATDAGGKPKYQWKLNNNNVLGATSNVWGTTTLSNGDNVCIEVTSTYACPQPATASTCKVVKIATGIDDVTGSHIRIYPNPATDMINIEGVTPATVMQLSDAQGRVVYSGTATAHKATINTANFVPGNYILLLTAKDGSSNSYKLVKE